MRTPKPRPITDDDLTWYWQQSASEMGIASSWGPMVSAAQGAFGGSAAKPDQRMTDAHMRATARHRAIRKRLDSLSSEHASTLWHVYGGTNAPPQTVAHLGQLANLAAHMPAAREAYEADQAKAKGGKAPKLNIKAWLALSCSSQHPALASIIEQTIQAFMAAIEAWKGTKKYG
jgi:hypothetical protein